MASTSATPRNSGGYSRMKSAASTLCADNQSLNAEIRRALNMMKEIAVDLEKDNKSEMVKQLEAGVIELVGASEECRHLSAATQSIANEYQPGSEQTDFKKLLHDEIAISKATLSSTSQNHVLFRQFREAVWNVHHAGEPMPGEEQEDIVMTNTQVNILNTCCPVTGKPVTELAEPVRSMDCKHIYEKHAIIEYMKKSPRCPIAGCPKALKRERVKCDPFLLADIEELRALNRETAQPQIIQDFTALDEEDE